MPGEQVCAKERECACSHMQGLRGGVEGAEAKAGKAPEGRKRDWDGRTGWEGRDGKGGQDKDGKGRREQIKDGMVGTNIEGPANRSSAFYHPVFLFPLPHPFPPLVSRAPAPPSSPSTLSSHRSPPSAKLAGLGWDRNGNWKRVGPGRDRGAGDRSFGRSVGRSVGLSVGPLRRLSPGGVNSREQK
jgi:hypothetical protein